MRLLLVTLMLCSAALAKDKPLPAYRRAMFQETHREPVRVNCHGSGYETSMTSCHDAEMLVYTVKIGETVYMLAPYGTRPHRESLWMQPAGITAAAWNDGKRIHLRIGAKESQYDIIGTSVEDATK